MKKSLRLFALASLIFLSKISFGQTVVDTPIEHYVYYKNPKDYKTFVINGRVLGVNLENVTGAVVTNIRTAEKTSTDGYGVYHIIAAKGDTLRFECTKYPVYIRDIRSPNENLNIVLFHRKVADLLQGYSKSDYNKAKKDDDELYRILDKDAKLDGKWKY